MMKLYNFHASSTSYRTRIVLNLKGLAYEYIPVRLDKGEHLSAAYGEINPMRGVPTLEVGGNRLYQSSAIIEYTRPPLFLDNRNFLTACRLIQFAGPHQRHINEFLQKQFRPPLSIDEYSSLANIYPRWTYPFGLIKID